jgi:hypothetical protein
MMALKAIDDDFKIKSIWPQLKKTLMWLMKNQFEGAAELLATIVTRRKNEMELEERKTQEQVKMMLEQVKHRKRAETNTILFEVRCGEKSRLMSQFKQRGGEGIRLYLPDHNVAKDYTIEAAKRVTKTLQEEGFTVKIWISIPCSPWCSWQRISR